MGSLPKTILEPLRASSLLLDGCSRAGDGSSSTDGVKKVMVAMVNNAQMQDLQKLAPGFEKTHLGMSAAALMASLPVVLFGWIAQKQFVRGLTMGTVMTTTTPRHRWSPAR